MEEWKDIQGFEGKYMVSNLGRVKSLERMKWVGKSYYKAPERILKAVKARGYLRVMLCKDGKGKWYPVHRLVAIAFIPNPYNLPEVNHKDEDKKNNCVQNLEWCSSQYNMEYSHGKAIIGINKINGLILEFPSIQEASRQTGINYKNINHCLKGRSKSAGGYVWYYAD